MKARELFTQTLWIVQGLDQGAARLPWDNGDTITADLLDFLNAAVLETATLRPDVCYAQSMNPVKKLPARYVQ